MGTRTDILKVVQKLQAFAAAHPDGAAQLRLLVAELETCAAKADDKRLRKKRDVENLLRWFPPIAPRVPDAPNVAFLSANVCPGIADSRLRLQLMDYERSVASFVQAATPLLQTAQRLGTTVNDFRLRWNR